MEGEINGVVGMYLTWALMWTWICFIKEINFFDLVIGVNFFILPIIIFYILPEVFEETKWKQK